MESRDSVSFLLTIQATGLLTLTLVGLSPTEYASLRWTHQHAGLSRQVSWHVRNNVVTAQRIRRHVDVRIVDVVADEYRVGVVEPVIEPEHPGVFANRVGGHFGQDIRDAIVWSLADRVSIDNRFERRRLREDLRTKGGIGHKIDERLAETLAQSFVIGIEERFVFHYGTAKARAELMQREGRKVGPVEGRARIECVVPNRIESAAVKFIRPGLRDDVDLRYRKGESESILAPSLAADIARCPSKRR